MKRRKKSPKKKPLSRSKINCVVILFILMPVLYGIYLCTPQIQAAISQNATCTSLSQVVEYPDLEIPLSLTKQKEQVIHHTGYTVSYNSDWRLPNWVGYELTRQEVQGTAKRSNRFTTDPLVDGPMATNQDYTRSGYDKGHMAPAADMKWGNTVMKESFYFSNICPQHPELNRRRWKDLEDKIRDWSVADSAIVIICGPIVNKAPQTIGKNQVTIPQHFFKVILSPYSSSPKAIGFIFSNKRSVAPLQDYVVSVDSIENLTGLDFFASLPDSLEDSIEAHSNAEQWGI